MTAPKDIAAARERLLAASRVHEPGVKVRTPDLRLLLSAEAEARARLDLAFDQLGAMAGRIEAANHRAEAAEASLAQARELLVEALDRGIVSFRTTNKIKEFLKGDYISCKRR